MINSNSPANLNPVNFYQDIETKNPQLKELFNQQLTNVNANNPEYSVRVSRLLACNKTTHVPAIYDFMTDEGFEKITDFLDLIIMEDRLSNKAKDFLLAAANKGEPALARAVREPSPIAVSGYMRRIIQSKLNPIIKQSRLNAQNQNCPIFYSLFMPKYRDGIILFAKEILEANNYHLEHSVKEAILTARYNNETALDVGIRLGFNSLVLQVAELILNSSKLDDKQKLNLVQPLDKLQVDLLNEEENVLWEKIRTLRGEILKKSPLFNIMYYAIFYLGEDQSNLYDIKTFLNTFFPNGKPLAYKQFCDQYQFFAQYKGRKNGTEQMVCLFKLLGDLKNSVELDKSVREIATSAFNDIAAIIYKEPTQETYDIFYNLFNYLNQFIILEIEQLTPPSELNTINKSIDSYLLFEFDNLQELQDIKDIFTQLEKAGSLDSSLFSASLRDLARAIYNAYYSVFTDDKTTFYKDPKHELRKKFLWVLIKLSIAASQKDAFSSLPENFRVKAFNSVKKHFITPLFARLDELKKAHPHKRRMSFDDSDDYPYKYQKTEDISRQSKKHITLIALLEEAPDSLVTFQVFYEMYRDLVPTTKQENQDLVLTDKEEEREKLEMFLSRKDEISESIWMLNESINNAKTIVQNNNQDQLIEFETKVQFVDDYIRLFFDPEISNQKLYTNFLTLLNRHIKFCLDHFMEIQTELYDNVSKKIEHEDAVSNAVPDQPKNQEETTSLEIPKIKNIMTFTDLVQVYFEKNKRAIFMVQDLIDNLGYVFAENADKIWFAREKIRLTEHMQSIKSDFIHWWVNEPNTVIEAQTSAEVDDFNKKINQLSINQSEDDYILYYNLYDNYFSKFYIEWKNRGDVAEKDKTEKLPTVLEQSIESIEEMPPTKLTNVDASSTETVQPTVKITLDEPKTPPMDNMPETEGASHQTSSPEQQSIIYNHLQSIIENYLSQNPQRIADLMISIKQVKQQKDVDAAFFDNFDDAIRTIMRLLNIVINSPDLTTEAALLLKEKIDGINKIDSDFNERYQAFSDLLTNLILPYYKKAKLSQVDALVSNGIFGAPNYSIANDNDSLINDDENEGIDFLNGDENGITNFWSGDALDEEEDQLETNSIVRFNSK